MKIKKIIICVSPYLQESLGSIGNVKREYCQLQHSSVGGGIVRKLFAQTRRETRNTAVNNVYGGYDLSSWLANF